MWNRLMGVCALALCLSACGGTRLAKYVLPLEVGAPLAQSGDPQLAVSLDRVIERNAAGSWAKNAEWDEYQLQFRSAGQGPVRVTKVVLLDPSGAWVAPESDRKALRKATKQAAKRIREWNLSTHWGGGRVAGTGVGIGLGAGGAMASSGGMLAGAAGAAVFVAVTPVFAVAGGVRAYRNRQVNREIVKRHTALPLELVAAQDHVATLFFPMIPAPQTLQVTYTDDQDEHVVELDTRQVLAHLHATAAREPAAARKPASTRKSAK